MPSLNQLLEKIKAKYRHGLILRFFASQLEKIGIDIFFYYWIQEGLHDTLAINPEEGWAGYSFKFFGPEEMKVLGNIPGREEQGQKEKGLLARLESGNMCFGATCKGQLAAFTWIDLTGKSFRDRRLELKNNEAYLYDMYTMHQFRGHNIAPLVRYQSYKKLHEMGRTILYSTSDVLNTPAVLFKKKLKARFLALYLNIVLFKKYHWNWKIKDYK